VDEIVTVTTDEICSAIKTIYEDTRSIVEPAGALATAGLIKDVNEKSLKGKTLVAINSGANMNFERLQFVAERTRTGQKKEAIFAVTIPEKPGSLREFCERFIGGRPITEFNYRYMPGNDAHVFVGIGTEKPGEREMFLGELQKAGYPALDMTDNELAKTHIRHMVGGRSEHTRNEYLYRFRFPERPGALSDFLNAMSSSWNISLFHYRMHGGDFGRVLIGLEISNEELSSFQTFLNKINYDAFDETENPAYRLFL
jgi:threonine dehydratase